MADTPQTLALITASLALTFPDQMAMLVNRRSVVATTLPVRVGRNQTVAWVVEDDGAIAENHTDGADAANFGSDAPRTASLGYGLYRSNFRVTDLAEMAGAVSQSPTDLNSPFAHSMFGGARKLLSTLNAAFYSGTGTGTTIAGFAIGIDSAGTYAGIDRGTYTNWQSYEVDASSAALTRAQIQTDLATIMENCGERPDVAYVKPATLNQIKSLFDSQRMYTKEVYTARGKTVLDSSADVVVIDGCQFIEDKDCTANTIFYVNSNEVEIEVLPNVAGWGNPIQANDGVQALMAGFYAYELGRTGDSRKASIAAKIQLKVRNPRACGKRTNIGS